MLSERHPLPQEFLDWQIALRRHTMIERGGTPHSGVVPSLLVRRPGSWTGTVGHSIVIGLLPAEAHLERKTGEFRALYEAHAPSGARRLYDAGLEYLRGYYTQADDFDSARITTLLAADSPLTRALEAEPRCAMLFNVFEPSASDSLSAPRSQQLDMVSRIHSEGAIYENVWWHNALFHGKADNHVVITFHHQRSWDTAFGELAALNE
jgi:hypothetical protein